MVCQARQMRRPSTPLPGKPDHRISEVSKDVSWDQRARLKRHSSVVCRIAAKPREHPVSSPCHAGSRVSVGE